MKKIYLLLTALILCFCFTANKAYGEDSQLWLTLRTKKSIHDWVSLTSDHELRLVKDVTKLGYLHTEVGLLFYLPKVDWLNVEINTRFLISSKWQVRPSIGIIYKLPKIWNFIKFSDRFRFELHFDETSFRKWRGRNRISIKLKLWENKDRCFYYNLSDEFFFTNQGIDENRLRTGLDYWAEKNIGFTFYYQLQVKRHFGFKYANYCFGTEAFIKF